MPFTAGRDGAWESDDTTPVYVISVAAELAGMHPQTLRAYEREGLLSPQRSTGNVRRYSARDVERLREIRRLTQDEGLNVAGVRMVLGLRDALEQVAHRATRLERELSATLVHLRDEVARAHASHRFEIVPMNVDRAIQPYRRRPRDHGSST